MRKRGGGVILNTSSAASLGCIPLNQIYAASKGAVNILTRDLAVELGPSNIRVNALCSMGGMSANFVLPPDAPLVEENMLFPDWDPTASIYVLHKPTPPRLIDHARVALFLASDEAAWISGVCMPIDGATSGKMALDFGKVLSNYQQAATNED